MISSCYNEVMTVPSTNRLEDGDNFEVASFGKALRFYRKRAGLSQADLAERVNISQTLISTWEGRADPPADPFTVSLIAEILDVDCSDLQEGRIRHGPQAPPVDPLVNLAQQVVAKYKGRISADEALEVIGGYLNLGDEERQHVRKQITLLRRSTRRAPPHSNDNGAIGGVGG